MREQLTLAKYTVPLVAVFPGLAAIAYPPAFWGPKGVLLYVAGWALFLFTFRWLLAPRMAAWGEREMRAREALEARLGRRPTVEEIADDRRRRKVQRG